MLIRFLKDYVNAKAGTLHTTKTDEDAEILIKGGWAEKCIDTKSKEEIDKEEAERHKKRVDEIVTQVKEQLKTEGKGKEFVANQGKDNPSGFKSLGEFAQSVKQGQTNPQLMNYCKSTGMNIAINAEGGFLIPPEFSTVLLTAMAQEGKLAQKCFNLPVNNNIELPFVNITDQSTSWTGGVRIYKPAEGVAKTGSKPAFAKCEMHLHEMAAVVYVTEQLLSDSPIALESFLTTMVSTEFALTKDEDIVNGSGAGEALGIMGAPCLVSIGKETDQDADTIVTENVLKMWSRLYDPSRSKAVWLISQDAMPQIATLTINVGTGGIPVLLANLAGPLPVSMLGAPIIWSPHCQTVGDKGDIILADFSQYVTISKAGEGEMQTATSIHLKFLENEVAFRFVIRFDGQPWWTSAITPKHGSNSVSPFITLDERT